MYDLNIAEEELKNKVAVDYFGGFDCTQILGEIDFCISFRRQSLYENSYFLWAEAKKGINANIYESFTQLVLTIARHKHHQKHAPPPFLGAFDAQKIAFIAYNKIMAFLDRSDFDYIHTTPSNHDSANFQKMHKFLMPILEREILLFEFGKNDAELREFIATNFILGNANLNQIQITEDNFVHIYIKWLNAVKPSIDIDWNAARNQGILDTDFYLADMLSEENKTLKDKLYILLKDSHYELLKGKNKIGLFEKSEVDFKDNQKAHKQFWNAYERPPKKVFWNKFINRRDLLVPEDIREREGAFYTPQMWVKKAQEYLAESLGESWQDEYYIWDCAAGTGNLLSGLKNARNIFASTLYKADADIIKELAHTQEKSIKLNLLENHIFQFDFLNDDFFDKLDSKGNIISESKLPKKLQNIINNESQKLVIFINPPYAEATSATTPTGTGQNKIKVARNNKICEKYRFELGKANNELFAQFFMRIYKEIPNCILGSFSTLKYVNSTNFIKFRQTFKAKFYKGFMIPAYTFDNVNSDFPIGFLVWNLGDNVEIKKCRVDIFNENNKKIAKKNFYANQQTINQWIKNFIDKKHEAKALLDTRGTDFQNQQYISIKSQNFVITAHSTGLYMTQYNMIPMAVYFAVRYAIKDSWINNNDQFLYPKNKWRKDSEFHNDCFTFTLFHGKNRISANQGINHFIPFSESQVGAKEAFESDFMVRFINGKIKNGTLDDCFIPEKPLEFSAESKAVFDAGLKLWQYYHKCAKNTDKYNNNASLYDIKEFFQGRNEKGKMNNKSTDSHYNDLIAELRIALKDLATKIEPKIYEYGFLRE